MNKDSINSDINMENFLLKINEINKEANVKTN